MEKSCFDNQTAPQINSFQSLKHFIRFASVALFIFFVLENPFCVFLHNEINAERVERWQKIKKRERKAGNVRQKN